MESLIPQLNELIPVSDELKQAVQSSFQLLELEKKSTLLKEGGYCQHFYFIKSGLVRSYYYQGGKERTYWLYPENEFFTSWYSFYGHHPSFEYFETLEDSLVYAISRNDFIKLQKEHPHFQSFAQTFAEQQLVGADFINRNFADLAAKERYDYLLTLIPNIEQRVSLGYIASLLGMSQETLSRIRAGK